MKTSLAGYNFLLVEKNKKEAQRLSEGLTLLGANLFVAHDVIQCQKLQEKWDIDVVLSEISFLVGLGDVVIQDPGRWSGKSAPLIFGYGQDSPMAAKKLLTRGMMHLFAADATAEEIASGIKNFLFDPKEHFRKAANADLAKQVTLVLQNAGGQWPMDVQQLIDDGLTGSVEGKCPEGETAVLTIMFPDVDKNFSQRFSVRVESHNDAKENVRLKVLFKDKDRWMELLRLIESKQSAIDNFLLMSSGR